MKQIIIFTFIFLLLGCFKKKEGLDGIISISGTVTDIESSVPIAHAVVKLVGIRQMKGPLGYNTVEDIVATDTTDLSGNYTFTYNSSGKYAFKLYAEPSSPLYVNSIYTEGQENINSLGNHTKDLQCHRSAYALVTIKNVPPIDTPYFLSLSGQKNIVLYNYNKDTTVYLKLVGKLSMQNYIRFNKNNQENHYPEVKVGPWDTIALQFNY